jgi:hypothetical protein
MVPKTAFRESLVDDLVMLVPVRKSSWRLVTAFAIVYGRPINASPKEEAPDLITPKRFIVDYKTIAFPQASSEGPKFRGSVSRLQRGVIRHF